MKNVIEQSLIQKISAEDFSCIGAKAAIANGTYKFCLLGEMANAESTQLLYESLKIFTQERMKIDQYFATFIACFDHPKKISADEFEQLLWKQLYLLHEKDEFEWDYRVSNDLNSPFFSFSIAGDAYFVIGMCPNHPRKCREFMYPALVFNSHHQFKYLKEINLFYKIKTIVRQRELKYSGSLNPNLVDFGAHSEALQYSGLKAAQDWKCPFRFDKKRG